MSPARAGAGKSARRATGQPTRSAAATASSPVSQCTPSSSGTPCVPSSSAASRTRGVAAIAEPERGGAVPLRPRRLVLFLLALLDLALELGHDVRVAERRDVAELLALGDVAQQAAHDLARARLGQVVGPDDALGPGELADPLGDVVADLVDQLVGALVVALEGHERRDRLA